MAEDAIPVSYEDLALLEEQFEEVDVEICNHTLAVCTHNDEILTLQ
jgi:hypothetical protein